VGESGQAYWPADAWAGAAASAVFGWRLREDVRRAFRARLSAPGPGSLAVPHRLLGPFTACRYWFGASRAACWPPDWCWKIIPQGAQTRKRMFVL